MAHPRLLFWHRIALLLGGAIGLLSVGIGLAIWHSLESAADRMVRQSKAVLSAQTESFIQKLAQGQAATLDGQLAQAQHQAEYGALYLQSRLSHPLAEAFEPETMLALLYRHASHCARVYYLSPDGELCAYPRLSQSAFQSAGSLLSASFFPRIGPDKAGAVWTPAHPDPLSRRYDLVADAVASVSVNGRTGYLGVSISLVRMIAQFNQRQPLRGSYTFIIDHRARLIGAPPHARAELSPGGNRDGRGVVALDKTANPRFRRLLERMVLGESAIRQLRLNGEAKYIAYHPIQTANWRLGLVIPVKMATAAGLELARTARQSLGQALIRILAWAGGLLLLALLAAFFLARGLTAPVRSLSRISQKIAQGDFSQRVRVRHRDELGQLAEAFNTMTDRIQAMIQDLNRINQELNHQNNALEAEISEREEAVLQLEASEARFRSLAEHSPDIIFTLGPDRRLSYVNPAFESLLGYPLSKSLGKSLEDFVFSEDQPRCRQALAGVFEHHTILRDLDLRIFPQHGGARFFSLSAAPREDGGDTAEGVVGICKDMTERHRLEKQLHNARKMEAIGTLAGGIAHDFNNLLMAIQGNISLMLLNTDKSHPHYAKLTAMERFVQSGSQLTRQLLGFARGGKYEVRPMDLNALVAESADMFGRTKKELQIHFQLAEALWPVKADKGQIEQVLLNLYVNAWQAMPEGGHLYIETRNTELPPEYVAPYEMDPGRFVKISVTDTGVGMDKQTQNKIFEPFFTTRQMGRGTGLGLASAYGIIKNHGGIINVYSETGRGTTFTIYLPALEQAESVSQSGAAGELKPGTGTILLVDDEAMILEVGRQLLESLGYGVLTAASGQEAVSLYRKWGATIDLVIVDMIMPEMGGERTFQSLRAISPTVRVLLSSGYSINGQASRILEQGCDGFIQKPFTLSQLSEKISRILSP